jgi:ribosomal protein S18 acetylase RimI-like enzyme
MTGPQSGLAEIAGSAGRFRPDVSPFHAVDGSPDGWNDLEALAAGETVVVFGLPDALPPGWAVDATIPCFQFVAERLPAPAIEFEILTDDDTDEMVALAKATNPGPFRPRTIEMGTYLGHRVDGRLVAMAGERLKPPGFTEISAVCTDPAHRRKGLARELTLAVAENIRDRGDEALLHVLKTNENAIALYRSLGFVLRREADVVALRKGETTEDRLDAVHRDASVEREQ